jgi:osmotically-inducible protein OsmY
MDATPVLVEAGVEVLLLCQQPLVSINQRTRAEDAVRRVRGIKGVINVITLKRRPL